MKTKRFPAAGLAVLAMICVGILSSLGCEAAKLAELKRDVTSRGELAWAELAATQETIATLRAEAEALPEGPARDAVAAAIDGAEKKAAAAVAIIDGAEKAAKAIDAITSGLETGEVPRGVTGALALIPGGAWVGFALSAILAINRQAKASQLRAHIENIVRSWDIGPELSKEEKLAVETVQGKATTALVAKLKGE